METIFVPLALLAGGLLPIQAGANAQLSKSVASPFAPPCSSWWAPRCSW